MKYLFLAPLLTPAIVLAQTNPCPDFSGRYRCASVRPESRFENYMQVSQTPARLNMQDELDGSVTFYEMGEESTNTIAPLGRPLQVGLVPYCDADNFRVSSQPINNVSMELVMSKTADGFRYEIRDSTGRQYDELVCQKQQRRAGLP